jgi:hypothetical protein
MTTVEIDPVLDEQIVCAWSIFFGTQKTEPCCRTMAWSSGDGVAGSVQHSASRPEAGNGLRRTLETKTIRFVSFELAMCVFADWAAAASSRLYSPSPCSYSTHQIDDNPILEFQSRVPLPPTKATNVVFMFRRNQS